MAKSFGEQMKEARREKGMTQEDLAKEMSVSRSTVSHWEIGRKVPEKEFLERLMQLLEVEFEFGQENEEVELVEENVDSLEVPSIEESSFFIRKLLEKQISFRWCVASICAAILLTSLVSWIIFRNWTPQDVERINFVISGKDASGDPLEYQGYIELDYKTIE